jgi:hypothetical protein
MFSILSMAARLARLNALLTLINEGNRIDFYAGTPPAKPELPTTQTLLASITLATPAGVVGVVDGVATLTITTPREVTCIKTGVIGWARFFDGLEGGIMDLEVGGIGSSSPVVLSDTKVYGGGELQLLSCSIAEQ